MVKNTDTLTLNNGQKIPILGLGTWESKPGEVEQAIHVAFKTGYKHIDGAMVYRNEPEIGRALKKAFEEKMIERKDLFYVSKLWNTFHHPDDVPKALEKTLSDLQLDYLDLYLIHWPLAFERGDNFSPMGEDGKVKLMDVDIADTWAAMEKLLKTGKVKAIGVSNFTEEHLEHLAKTQTVVPAMNQIELHPYLPQHKLLDYCKKKGILVTAYSPLGRSDVTSVLGDETIGQIAKKMNKTPAGVVLSWAAQRSTVVIPKSVTPARIESNFDIFTLSEEDMQAINGIKKRNRIINKAWGLELGESLFKGNGD